MTTPQPLLKLSVIVAAQDAGDLLRRCLSGLMPQLPSDRMEVLVVTGKTGALPEIARDFPAIRTLAIPAPHNVPRLWAAGLVAAKGGIIALTIENCIPAQDWATSVLAANEKPWLAIGGAIEPCPNGNYVNWAVYFCRYSNYMLPFQPRFLEDLAADNCSYKRTALEGLQDVERDGFWETLVHGAMCERQEKLFSDPSLKVTFGGGISVGRFLRRRYDHGRYFAARRSEGFTFGQRLVRTLGAPVVPVVLLRRISGRVFGKRRYGAQFAACLPLIACFLVAWAFGEGVGYLAGYPEGGPAE